MTLEWLRRKQPVFAENIATYINSSGPILEVEEQLMGAGGGKGEGGGAPSTGKGEGGVPATGKGEGGASKSKAGSSKSYNSSESLGIGSLKGQK
jgi:hypothetical protein